MKTTATITGIRLLAVFVATLMGISDAAEPQIVASFRSSKRVDSSRAAGFLFNQTIIADNIDQVCNRADALPPDQRYEYLRRWVLPSDSHDAIRVSAKMTPGDPVTPLIDDHPFDAQRIRVGRTLGQSRIHTGGNLISPVFDLVQAAKEVQQLDDLRSAIDRCGASGEIQQRYRLLLRCITAMADSDEKTAGTAADELYRRFSQSTMPDLAGRWPETMFPKAAVENQQLLLEAETFLTRITDAQLRTGTNVGPGEWDRMIGNLNGRIRRLRQKEPADNLPYTMHPRLRNWHAVSLTESWAAGCGVPAAHWQLMDQTVVNLSSHGEEYLMFGVPLRGNYVFECECSGFGYRNCHPSVAGTWIAPAHHHASFQIGNLLAVRRSVKFEPKLSQTDDWIWYRVEMQNGVCSRFINGRLAHQEQLPENHDPWVAIRVPHGCTGHVRDVRISGNPIVPRELSLTSTSHVTSPMSPRYASSETDTRTADWPDGWMPWVHSLWDSAGSSWQPERHTDGTFSIIGRKQPALSETTAERLLRYHWPLIHDCEISYEFFFREGAMHAHPAIGRRAFLLNTTGVETHWVTNGIYDLTTLDPLNSHSKSLLPVPLRDNAWNSATLQIKGDAVSISVNGISVFAGKLHLTNDRTFGLFHYCDQTEARIRNVVLKGDWPKNLPELMEQELCAVETFDLKQRRNNLAAGVDYDFTNHNTDFSRNFETYGNADNFQMQDDGLHVDLTTPSGRIEPVYAAPRISVAGDFDFIATFSDLALMPSSLGTADIHLEVTFPPDRPNGEKRYRRILRGVTQRAGKPLRHLTQVAFYETKLNTPAFQWFGTHAEACTSGRLRVTRVGKVVSFLIAEDDSDSFRKIYSEEISEQPLELGDIHLRSRAYSTDGNTSSMSVVWKHLSIKAERVTRSTD